MKNEAFRLLSDETRLKILQALGAADGEAGSSPVRFSDLRERLGADDPGRLDYHLNELRTHFIRRADEGYELRESGRRILRVLLSGTAILLAEEELRLTFDERMSVVDVDRRDAGERE